MLEAFTWEIAKGKIKSFLFKYGPLLLILLAIGGVAWFLDHRGYERAEAEGKARELERQQITNAVVRQLDVELGGQLAAIAVNTSGKIQTIDTEGKTVVQPIITREILRDRSLTDPNRCLSPGLLEAVNAARGYLDEHLAGDGPANPPSVPGPVQGH